MPGTVSASAATSPARPGSVAPASTGFCRLAAIYSTLEMAMFGRKLEQARFCHLGHLQNCRGILLLGEGDGRCLAKLVKIAPSAHFYSVDSSPAMLARAAARLSLADRARVTFVHANILAWSPPPAAFDAVVSCFFLDCFSAEEVGQIVKKIQPTLLPGALWLWADFILPPSGLARWRAQVWLRVMYRFFRHSAGLATRALPPTEEILLAAGWRPVARRAFQGIFALSVVFNHPGCAS